MSFGPREYLRHIVAEVEYLLRESDGLEEEAFLESETLRRAFVRALEVIGEATKKLPREFRDAHPEVQWRAMAGMRDRLIHGYFGVDYDLVWDVVRKKIPELQSELAGLSPERDEGGESS